MTANTEMIQGAEDLSSLLDWKAGSVKLPKEEVSASPLDVLKSRVEALAQHLLQTAATTAFTSGLGGGQRMKCDGGKVEEVGQGETAACFTSLNETLTPERSCV